MAGTHWSSQASKSDNVVGFGNTTGKLCVSTSITSVWCLCCMLNFRILLLYFLPKKAKVLMESSCQSWLDLIRFLRTSGWWGKSVGVLGRIPVSTKFYHKIEKFKKNQQQKRASGWNEDRWHCIHNIQSQPHFCIPWERGTTGWLDFEPFIYYGVWFIINTYLSN